MGAGTNPLAVTRKILTLALVFSVAIYLGASYFESLGAAEPEAVPSAGSGSAQAVPRFRPVGQASLALVGVALGNGIATSGKLVSGAPVALAGDALDASDALAAKNIAPAGFIGQNMAAIKEYANVLSVNVRGLLASSPDRAAVLESYIDQVKYRHSASSNAMAELSAQVVGATQSLNTLQAGMDALKKQISGAYARFDAPATQGYLRDYLDRQETYVYTRSYLVFAQKFAVSYQRLNAYAKTLLDTLSANREALVKNATVVIPDSGASLLKSLDLVTD